MRTAAAFVAAVLFSASAFAAPNDAKSAVLIDADTGKVLYAKNECARSAIASTTKIMTALIVLENTPLSREFTVPAEACGIEGSSMGLRAGETLSVRTLLYGLMLQSGNDAALALALCAAGETETFVARMNEKARALGLGQTHFANPHGLDDPENYSTALDLARLAAHALKNDEFLRIVSTSEITLEGRTMKNHNRLLRTLDGAIGVKTGYTKSAGRILVSAAQRGGRRLIAVTLCDGNDWRDHARLYDEGFAAYAQKRVLARGQTVAEVALLDGTSAPVCAATDVFCNCAEGEAPTFRVLSPCAEFFAGTPGEAAGQGGVFFGERCVQTFPLIWGRRETQNGADSENYLGARRDVAQSGGSGDCAGARDVQRARRAAR